jgi:hypothetical protein
MFDEFIFLLQFCEKEKGVVREVDVVTLGKHEA